MWQDIETAPRNGDEFLAYGAYLYDGDFALTEYMRVANYSGNPEWPWEDDEGQHPVNFYSHWQPLPEPPNA